MYQKPAAGVCSGFSFALCLQLSCAYQNVKGYFENRVSQLIFFPTE